MLLLAGLLVLWIVLAVIGFMFKALLWLAFVALAFFAVTVIASAIHLLKEKP
jgi:hypothetical protein